MQKGNIPELASRGYNLELDIYTKAGEYEEIIQKYSSRLSAIKEYLAVSIIPLEGYEPSGKNDILLEALIAQIRKCINENAMMFSTPPDTIFGNHSISNAVKLVEGKDVCLAAAHPRIRKESVLSSGVFDKLKHMEITIENDELVDLAFQFGHSALLNSFDNEDENTTWAGLSIRKINKNTYSIISNLPTVYLANFTERDLKFFEDNEAFNAWDREWLRTLVNRCRVKFIGSSDLFFCVEVTPSEPGAISKKGLLNNDKYLTRKNRHLGNYVCNSFCCLWRGREQ